MEDFNILEAARRTRARVCDEPNGFADNLHLLLSQSVRNGEYESYIDAFMGFVVDNDIDLNSAVITKYISPALRQILYNEALERGLLREKNGKNPQLSEELFS